MELHCRLPPLHDFTPIAVGTLGAVRESVLDFLQEHGRRITRTTAEPHSFMCDSVFLYAIADPQNISVIMYVDVTDMQHGVHMESIRV